MIPQFEPMMLDSYAEEVKLQIISGWVGPGKRTKEFEDGFAKYTHSPYAIANSSGTASLIISLLALGVGPGDDVLVPDYSFIAAVNAIRFIGANPILVDIDFSTLCMNITLAEKELTPKTKALIFINHNGYVGEAVRQARLFCSEYKIKMIEDAACALGQWDLDGFHAGTRADVGCFSFSVPKIITTGQGGMIITKDKNIDKRCREIVDQGSTTWRQTGVHENTGANFKFNDISAALGMVQLNKIKELLDIRYNNYIALKNKGVPLRSYPTLSNSGTWMNILTSSKADQIIEELDNLGYQAKKLYKPTHFSYIEVSGLFPETEKAWKECVYLPSSLTLTLGNINDIAKAINQIIYGDKNV